MRHRFKSRLVALLILLAAPANMATAARAGDDGIWPVEGKLIGKPKKDSEKEKKAKNISGIACSTQQGFPRACLVIDDEVQDAQFVTLKDGEIVAGETIPLIDNKHNGKPVELDGEGVAYADRSYFITTGGPSALELHIYPYPRRCVRCNKKTDHLRRLREACVWTVDAYVIVGDKKTPTQIYVDCSTTCSRAATIPLGATDKASFATNQVPYILNPILIKLLARKGGAIK